MEKVLKYLIKGAIYGSICAVGLAVFICNVSKSLSFDLSILWRVILYGIIGGAVIGLCYGFYLVKETSDYEAAKLAAENSVEARKQREKWANELKQKASNASITCYNNKLESKLLPSSDYKANEQMTAIMNELTKAAEKQGRLDALVEELSMKGGAAE